MTDVSVVIPTLNEEEAIGKVIDECNEVINEIKKKDKPINFEIIIVDGNSHDKTREIAQKKGTRVIIEERKGKGIAMQTAFKKINSEYLIMLDGDGSYDSKHIPEFLKYLQTEEADLVIGRRIFKKNSITTFNKFGNKVMNWLIRTLYHVKVHDVNTGYKGFTKSVYKNLTDMPSRGFDVEVNIFIEAKKLGFSIKEVPVQYSPRTGKSNLNPLRDGAIIIGAIVRLLRDYNPILFFGSIGLAFLIAGFGIGLNVVTTFNNKHYLMIGQTLITILCIFIGIQTIYFGLLSDLIIRKVEKK